MGQFSFYAFGRTVIARGRLVAHLMSFELGRQVRQPLYWISTILLFLGGVGLMAMDDLGSSQVPRNAPSTLAMAAVFMNLPYVVIMAALAGDAAVRDARSGFESVLRSTPMLRWQHVLGRLLGVQAATVFAILIGFCGLLAGSTAPWVQASAMGPYHWPQIALVAAVLVAPLAMSVSAVFFCLAAVTRSIAATTTAAMGFLLVFFASLGLLDLLNNTGLTIVALAEPMGVFALRADISEMSIQQQALQALPLDGWLVLNRLVRSPSLWVMVTIMVVVAAFSLRTHTTVDSAPKPAGAADPDARAAALRDPGGLRHRHIPRRRHRLARP